MRVKKTPKPEAEPKPKKVAPKTEAPVPIEKEIPAMPVAESRPVEPVEVSCVYHYIGKRGCVDHIVSKCILLRSSQHLLL